MNSLQQGKRGVSLFSHIGVKSELGQVSDTHPEGCLCVCENVCVRARVCEGIKHWSMKNMYSMWGESSFMFTHTLIKKNCCLRQIHRNWKFLPSIALFFWNKLPALLLGFQCWFQVSIHKYIKYSQLNQALIPNISLTSFATSRVLGIKCSPKIVKAVFFSPWRK